MLSVHPAPVCLASPSCPWIATRDDGDDDFRGFSLETICARGSHLRSFAQASYSLRSQKNDVLEYVQSNPINFDEKCYGLNA